MTKTASAHVPGARGLGRPPFTRGIAIACVLVLAAAGVVWWLFLGANERRITAHFSAAVGIYPGGEVRVLGVPVGRITAVAPEGKTVRVEMAVDRDVEIPADATAVAVSPTVVGDRYVQLTPVYRGGPTMPGGAVIPPERTASPVELDQIYRSLNELTKALGPNGANADGALSDLLDTAAANLGGNGRTLSETLRELGEAGTTLSGSSEDFFATVESLQKFTSMLARNDRQVREFNEQMAEVNRFLAGEREDLGTALAELAVALGKVEKFVRDNRESLKSNVGQLNSVAKVLVEQQAALEEVLVNAPLALGNLQNAYNASSGTLDTRAMLNELSYPPIVGVCKLLQQTSPAEVPGVLMDACGELGPMLNGGEPLPSPAEVLRSLEEGQLPPLPLPVSGLGSPAPGASGAARGGDR